VSLDSFYASTYEPAKDIIFLVDDPSSPFE
jgi:hypothetical protein